MTEVVSSPGRPPKFCSVWNGANSFPRSDPAKKGYRSKRQVHTRSRQSAQDRGAKSSARTCAGALETNRQPWMRQTPSRRPSRRTRSCTPPCPASRSSDPLLPPHCCVWPAFPQRPEYAHRVCPDRAALDVQGAKLFVRCFRRSAVPVCAPSRTLISPAQPYPMHWHRCR
jgi:hypothetical protein